MRLKRLDLWRCFIVLVPVQRPRLNFHKIWWLWNCMCSLRLFALELVLEVTLHSLEHFTSNLFPDFGLKWILFLKILDWNLFFPIRVFLHTSRHVCSFDRGLSILINSLFPFLLFLHDFLIVNQNWAWLRDWVGFKLSSFAFGIYFRRSGLFLCHFSQISSPEVKWLFVRLGNFYTLLFDFFSPFLVGLHYLLVSRLEHSVRNGFTS